MAMSENSDLSVWHFRPNIVVGTADSIHFGACHRTLPASDGGELDGY
jgi:hypothetical protein